MAFNFDRKNVRAHQYQRLRKEWYGTRFGAVSYLDFEWKIRGDRKRFVGNCEVFCCFFGAFPRMGAKRVTWLNS